MNQTPDFVQRLLNEGLKYLNGQDPSAAFECFDKIIRKRPQFADAWYLSGLAAQHLNLFAEAAQRIEHAIGLAPGNPFHHLNLGNALQSCGDLSGAEAQFRHALLIDPRFSSAHYNLGNLLVLDHRQSEARDSYDRAVLYDPGHTRAMLALAHLLVAQGQHQPGAALAQRVASLKPDEPKSLLRCLQIFIDTGYNLPALTLCRQLLLLLPDDPEIPVFQGRILIEEDRFNEAVEKFRRAIQQDPEHRFAYILLTGTLTRIGETESAIQILYNYQKSHPEDIGVYSHYLSLLNYSAHISPTQLRAAHFEWETRLGETKRMISHSNSAVPTRKLRIGYVSADFRRHAVAHFLEPVITHHDSENFEIFAYSRTEKPDCVTTRFKNKVACFRDAVEMTHTDFVNQIIADKIDILVDLSGHLGGNCLPAFAMKPAPLQLTWLGYPNTTGLSNIDYRISDAIADPEGEEEENSECILRLPNCFLCYRPGVTLPVNPTPPSEINGYITFSSYNALGKLSDPTLSAWSRILDGVPNSRLVVKSYGLNDRETHKRLNERLYRHEIDPSRVSLIAPHPRYEDHMGSYRQSDIALDSFPYNGTTTTCDALWMGVPVICMIGDRHAARVSASLLHAVNLKELSELVANTVDQYISTAISLAGDSDRLSRLHQNLRPAMQESPLMNEVPFTRNLEGAYRNIWQNWCAYQSSDISNS